MQENVILECSGGTVLVPSKPLNGRQDGGHLLVNPPRAVWERSELTPLELTHWSFLVAATGKAMLNALPQLAGGCINYWEAGNWSLHPLAAPAGTKSPRDHRRVHLHLFGRSPTARNRDWQWGESPRFPAFVHSQSWSEQFERLGTEECAAIRAQVSALLRETYGIGEDPAPARRHVG